MLPVFLGHLAPLAPKVILAQWENLVQWDCQDLKDFQV